MNTRKTCIARRHRDSEQQLPLETEMLFRWELKDMRNAIVLDIGIQLYALPDNSLQPMLL